MKHILSISLLALGLYTVSLPSEAISQSTSELVDRYAKRMFNRSAATGLALVVIDNNQVHTRYLGETRPGNKQRPGPDSLIRIASLTKLMTSEIMVKLEAEGMLKITDPLSKYKPHGASVLKYSPKRPITLLNLATHTSGLPREQPGNKPANAPVFTWPTKEQRWKWLTRTPLKVSPGAHAFYSNLAYDLLADALSQAAKKPYSYLLREKITQPLGMNDTTLSPSLGQCLRLMIPAVGASACGDTQAASGSGGVYSTPRDMQRWMQQFLSTHHSGPKPTAMREQTMYFQRRSLIKVIGMDVPGTADALGLGWVYMSPKKNLPGIFQKTGGGGGFITYIAMVPDKNVGIFVVATRSAGTRFSNMSNPVHQLIAELIKKQLIINNNKASYVKNT